MSDIRIQQSINVTKVHQKKAAQKKEEVKTESQEKAPEVKHKSADEVLEYLSGSAIAFGKNENGVQSKTTIRLSEHITPAQAKGIGESTVNLFNSMEAYVQVAMKEFKLSRESAEDLVSLRFNQMMDGEDDNAAIIATGQRFIQ